MLLDKSGHISLTFRTSPGAFPGNFRREERMRSYSGALSSISR